MREYNYKLDVFEGPLDLLLHLIEKHKIEITDIPIVEITGQYLAYLDNWNHFDIYYSSEFLVMASTLLQIKSRMLLPRVEPDEADDPRDELVGKLVEFKKIKDFTAVLKKHTLLDADLFTRPEETSLLGVDRYYSLELAQLYSVFCQVLQRSKDVDRDDGVRKVTVEKDTYSVEDMIVSLMSRARRGEELRFRRLLTAIGDRSGMVTIFMAVLELLKRQELVMRHEGDDLVFQVNPEPYERNITDDMTVPADGGVSTGGE